MRSVAWLAPAVSSSPVDQLSTTSALAAFDSSTLNQFDATLSTVESDATVTLTASSSTIVPTAVAVPMLHPAGVGLLIVSLKVSSPSMSESPMVPMAYVLEVSPSGTKKPPDAAR